LTATDPRDRRWPIAIALGLALVIAVNILFAYIAVHGADDIVASYDAEPR
jgi:nitrogen fixation protein FixH